MTGLKGPDHIAVSEHSRLGNVLGVDAAPRSVRNLGGVPADNDRMEMVQVVLGGDSHPEPVGPGRGRARRDRSR